MYQQDNIRASGQVELAIRRIDEIDIPSAVIEKFLQATANFQFTPSDLVELAESEPALVIALLKLAKQQDISVDSATVRTLVENFKLRAIRDTLLSMNIYPADKREGGFHRIQMNLFAVACGCCCRKAAEKFEDFDIQPDSAYIAGLLSTIGNFVLEQVTPKSFSVLVQNASTEKQQLYRLQRENLGIDFARAGKRFLEKFDLPDEMITGVWLQRSGVLGQVANVPEAQTARLIVLAQYAAKLSGLGEFEIYSPDELAKSVMDSMGVSESEIKEISEECTEEIKTKAEKSGIYKIQTAGADWRVFYEAAGKLAKSDTLLFEENSELRKTSSSLSLVKELISGLSGVNSVFDALEKIAENWKDFYQTGKVCVYAVVDESDIAAVLVESANKKSDKIISIQNQGTDEQQDECPEWLLEQFNAEFDSCRVVPLSDKGKFLGAVVFELRYPGDCENIKSQFQIGAFAGSVLLKQALKQQKNQRLTEILLQSEKAEPAGKSEQKKEIEPDKSEQSVSLEQLNSELEEIAAGAAHELNNPLSVISGRAQLLLNDEQDQQRKQLLEKISTSAEELSQIVAGLMSYAQPQPPRKSATSVQQIVDEAVQFAEQKTDMENIGLETDIKEQQAKINVDSGQIVSALANVIVNAAESYDSREGPVQITVLEEGAAIQIKISDFGKGMDKNTLQRACCPFFSNKPAGRQRGMGLAYTKRFVELNGGNLKIESETDRGTTVTISL
jgi:signal transduction histidine kinase